MSDPLHDMSGVSFFGISARQIWADVVLWELFFKEHPEIKTVIELGSGGHGLSVIFALHGVTRGFELITIDRKRYDSLDWPLSKLLGLTHTFYKLDIFGKGSDVQDFITFAEHPLLLFCDNGDKPREFRTFVPYLQPGDFVGVHDWEDEFLPVDTLEVAHLVEAWRFDLAKQLGCITRIWKRKGGPA